MKIVALTVTRNDAWVLGLSMRAALKWVDHTVVLNHASTDETEMVIGSVISENPGKVTVITEKDPVWMEMDHRQRTLDVGRQVGGTHFAIVDSDEVPTANVLPKLRGWFEGLKPGQLLDLPMIPTWGSLDGYRCEASGIWSKSWLTLGFADNRNCFWRPKEDGYQYHNRPPYGTMVEEQKRIRPVGGHNEGGVMHLQFAAIRRLLWKHIFYQMDEVLRWPGREPNLQIAKKYTSSVREQGIQLRPCPKEWWQGYNKDLVNLAHVPWQEAECKRLLKEHGREVFKGLNFFGLL